MQSSKSCQLDVKRIRYQNRRKKRKWFFNHSTTLIRIHYKYFKWWQCLPLSYSWSIGQALTSSALEHHRLLSWASLSSVFQVSPSSSFQIPHPFSRRSLGNPSSSCPEELASLRFDLFSSTIFLISISIGNSPALSHSILFVTLSVQLIFKIRLRHLLPVAGVKYGVHFSLPYIKNLEVLQISYDWSQIAPRRQKSFR